MRLKPWAELTRAQQDLYITVLWQDGHSEQAIADFLQTTKGPIVRRRQLKLKLPNTGRPDPLNVKTKVDPKRFADLLDLRDMEELEKKGVAAIAPPSPHEEELIISKEEPQLPAHTCEWPLPTSTKRRPVLCGKPTVPGHRVCEEHLSLVSRYLPKPPST